MRAAYVKAPFQITVKEVSLRPLKETEVLIDIKVCGVCGHDLILMRSGADSLQQFGHEAVGVVLETGRLVTNVKPGDNVVLENGTFDRFSDNSRNGRVDLDNKGPNFWIQGDDNMGFADEMIVPCECCVKYDSSLSYEQVAPIEPLGVALDLVKTADIRLMNDVLVMGLGPIELMAARLAKVQGARKVYATEISSCEARIELAKKWGVDKIICPDKEEAEKFPFERGGVDRVLVTAPPFVLPSAVNVCRVGGIVAFLGISYGEDRMVTFDANTIHFQKLQLRGSHASPALYFPECLDLIASGAVDTKALITHKFLLEDIKEAVQTFEKDKKRGIKAIMVKERGML